MITPSLKHPNCDCEMPGEQIEQITVAVAHAITEVTNTASGMGLCARQVTVALLMVATSVLHRGGMVPGEADEELKMAHELVSRARDIHLAQSEASHNTQH